MARLSGTTDNNPTITAATVTNADTQILAQNKQRKAMWLFNPDAAATVYVQVQPMTGNAVAVVAAAAGTIPIAPNAAVNFDAVLLQGALRAISSAASSPLTILEWT